MFRCSAHRLSQTRRAVSLRWHSAPSRAGPRRYRGFSSSVAAAGFPPTAPSPSVSSPFTAPIPPPSLRHSSLFCRPGSHVRSALPSHQNSTIRARAGKTIISSLDLHTVRLLPRLSACLLTLGKTERTMLPHRPFRLPPSRAIDIFTLLIQCIMEPHHTQGVRTKSIFISNRKHSRASATRFISIVFRFDILVTAINTLYATYVVKTCNALSPYA